MISIMNNMLPSIEVPVCQNFLQGKAVEATEQKRRKEGEKNLSPRNSSMSRIQSAVQHSPYYQYMFLKYPY
jgi:hypothetical protein